MPAWEKVAPEPASWSFLRRSPGSTTQVRRGGALCPGSCASGDDRSSCRGRSESPTQQEGSLSGSSFQGNHRVVGRLLRAESARLPVAIYSHSVTGPCPRSPGQDPPRTGRTQPGRRYAVPTLQARVPVVTSLIVILSALENSAASLGAGKM